MYEYKAYVKRVVDGDTLVIIVDLGFRVSVEATIRLLNVNTPEKWTDEGKEVKKKITDLIQGKTIIVNTKRAKGKKSFDRWLGDIEFFDKTATITEEDDGWRNLKTYLIENNMGQEFDPKKDNWKKQTNQESEK